MPDDMLLRELRAPAAEYDVALLDLDGVVYNGPDAVPGAAPALAAARKAGMRLAFVTNNASRSPSAIAEQLSGQGVPATSADVVTSAQAAATLIANRFPPGSPVLVAGAIGLRLALRERGLRPVSVAADRPVAVAQGYAPDMSYGLLADDLEPGSAVYVIGGRGLFEALAAAMRPDLRHYTDALRSVRATLRARGFVEGEE